jgi:pimeloyl-ACP methyl ester carboxylesterase
MQHAAAPEAAAPRSRLDSRGVEETQGSFRHAGSRLAYSTYGEGPRLAVLVHGLLFNGRMHAELARSLAARGHRVVCPDLLGHGGSDRPRDMGRYSMTEFGREVVALLDHLEAEQAVVMGTSLGANTTLEVASIAPERLRGMVVEMPVLDNALLGCAVAFTPLMLGLTFGAPAARVLARAARLVPRRGVPWQADILLDWIRQDPAPSAAVIQGLFFGRVAPPREERLTFAAPALVIGHRHDAVHPFSDAGMLVDELPGGRLLQANSIVELRLAPERLTAEIAAFLDECWRPRAAGRRRAG